MQKATTAKENTDNSQITERIKLAYHSALTEDLINGNGELTKTTLKTELNKEFAGKEVKIIDSADKKNWIIEVDNVKVSVKAYRTPSNLTTAELTAIEENNTKNPSDKIEELTGESITNENLKNTTNIKAVLTGEVPIPVDGIYKKGTKSTGLVIEYKQSEFVWVPVPEINKMVMCDKHTSGECNIQINNEGIGLVCKTEEHKVNDEYNTEIVGRLYGSGNNGENFNSSLTTQRSNEFWKEPSISTYDNNTSYNNGLFTLNSLKTEYREMALSVAKYGGFYIGRYETSIDGNTVASKGSTIATGEGAIMPMTAEASSGNMIYGMYSKLKNFSTVGMQSNMIWGSQYDAMLKWMLEGTDSSHVTATTNGNHSGSVKGTGSTSTDKINNIYDLEGNLVEWTLESQSDTNRVYRGGYYIDINSPSARNGCWPFRTFATVGTRISLCIKP